MPTTKKEPLFCITTTSLNLILQLQNKSGSLDCEGVNEGITEGVKQQPTSFLFVYQNNNNTLVCSFCASVHLK